jgi:hypothetical protein
VPASEILRPHLTKMQAGAGPQRHVAPILTIGDDLIEISSRRVEQTALLGVRKLQPLSSSLSLLLFQPAPTITAALVR